MIASVRGRVQSVRLDAAVVDVGGVGLLVQATPGTLAGLRHGEAAELATSLVVREESLTLFGFADADERDVFEVLQTVSGIGPRLALAMLAVHTPEGLRRAVATEDLVALTRVPGIGRKGAQRIVLELADRLGPPGAAASDRTVTAGPPLGGQVVEALVGLGWNVRQAEDAVATVTQNLDGGGGGHGGTGDVGTGNGGTGNGGTGNGQARSNGGGAEDTASVLRAALRHLGRG